MKLNEITQDGDGIQASLRLDSEPSHSIEQCMTTPFSTSIPYKYGGTIIEETEEELIVSTMETHLQH